MSGLEILAVVAIIGCVIRRQLAGQLLRGRRVVLLPAVLTVVGFTDLRGAGHHLAAADVVCLTVGAVGSVLIGLGFGAVTRLEARDGVLWGRMPVRGLWLWAALVGWRGVVLVLAAALHAHVGASSATLLLTLGLNRLGQAAVIVPRAMASGVPFAPEKNGRTFLAGAFERGRTGEARTPRLPRPRAVRSDRDRRDERGDADDRRGSRPADGRRNGDGHRDQHPATSDPRDRP